MVPRVGTRKQTNTSAENFARAVLDAHERRAARHVDCVAREDDGVSERTSKGISMTIAGEARLQEETEEHEGNERYNRQQKRACGSHLLA